MLTTSLGRLLLFTYTPREIHATTLHGDLVAYLFENCYRTKQALSGKNFFFFFLFHFPTKKYHSRFIDRYCREREKVFVPAIPTRQINFLLVHILYIIRQVLKND